MRGTLILWAIAACAYAYDQDDVQSVKSVKGPSRYIYKGGDNISRFYNSRQYNLTKHREVEEIGVCYIEIPTAQLVSDQNHVPAGNGSRPDLSRIRSCCHGFTRNIHDFMVCDPVCSKGCVNALCIAPETCQCYPDYVKNAAGFCTATCPIGCQNGHCSGGECICDSGYKLDSESKYCMPSCKDNCGGLGNCTAPNTCSCQPGYQSTPDGSCKPVCENCENGECTAPNTCTCRTGYVKDGQGKCKPLCTPACQHNSNCIAPNVCSPPPSSDYSPQYNGLPLNVTPLQPESQVNNSSHPHSTNQYPNPYNPNYPQGPHNQYPRNNYFLHNPLDQPIDNSQDQDGQVPRHPDETFYHYQRPSYYHQPGGQNIQQGNWPNNTSNPSQQKPGEPIQQSNQYPINPYPGVGPEINPNRVNSSYPHRGDIDSENSKYPGQVNAVNGPTSNNTVHVYPYSGSNYNPNYQESNSYYAGGRHQNSSWNSMNQYGSVSQDSSDRRTYDQTHQGTYNRSQQESYDSRNQRTFDSSQHESYNNSNQRSFDSSQHHPYGTTHHDRQYDSEYQTNNGNFNQDTQNSSAHGQHDASHQTGYGNRDIQTTGNYGTYGSSQQGAYDSSRRETGSSTTVGNFDSHYGTNQGPYPYYTSNSNPKQTPEPSNQVTNQTGFDNSHHTTVQGVHNTFDIDQQTNDVPICSQPCINSYCVEGNECKCKPGYIPDKSYPNMCLPHCPGGCPNGVCSGPRLCLCNIGYHKDTSVKGRQVCVKRNR